MSFIQVTLQNNQLSLIKNQPLRIPLWLRRNALNQLKLVLISHKTENLNLLGEFTYTVKNFGRICDGLFEERTRFHLGQRFGKRLAKPGALTVRARVSKDTSQLFTLG